MNVHTEPSQVNPAQLPVNVRKIYERGSLAWVMIVKTAVRENIININKLTDIIFYLNNPELEGRPLEIGETKLIAEWKGYRTLIKIIISKLGINSEDSRNSDNYPTPAYGKKINPPGSPDVRLTPSQPKIIMLS